MTDETVSGFKVRKGKRLYGTYVRYVPYSATAFILDACFIFLEKEAVRMSKNDIEKCNPIKKTAMGKMSSPDSLVSIFVSLRSAASSTSSL